MSWTYVGYAAVAIGSAVVTDYLADENADEAYARSEAAAGKLDSISQQQMDLATEQWGMYRDEIFPMEKRSQEMGLEYQELGLETYSDYYNPLSQQFATEAMEGIEADPERAAREARLSVDQQFDTEESMMQRNLERRGVRPGSGAYESDITDTSLSRAAAKGFTVNRAVEAERDRVEDANFNRMAVALGRQPTVVGGSSSVTPSAAGSNLAGAGNTAYGAASQFGNLGNTYANAAGDTVSGAINLGMSAYDLYNKYSTPAAPTTPTTAYSQGQAQTGTAYAPGSDAEFAAFAEGGPVDVPPTLQRGSEGMVNGPPGRDMVPAYVEAADGTRAPAKLTDNEYVIPADVVHVIGTGPLDDIIEKARNRKQKANQSPNALTRRVH